MRIVRSKVAGGLVLILIAIFFLWKRCNKFSRERPIGSSAFSNNLYSENYYIGLFNLDRFSYYITDSSSFRKFIGIGDSKEYYICEDRGDSIIIRKWTWRIDTNLKEKISIITSDTINDSISAEKVKSTKRLRILFREKYKKSNLEKLNNYKR